MLGPDVLDSPRIKVRASERAEDLQEDEAEAPHVGAGTVAPLSHVHGRDFRGHVRRGAGEDVASPELEPICALRGVFGVTKVGEYCTAASVDEDVAGLDVAVDDAEVAERRDGTDLYMLLVICGYGQRKKKTHKFLTIELAVPQSDRHAVRQNGEQVGWI